MIVTIDGPAGAGKSSIARQVAENLGFEFLDTGAMYRAATLGAIRSQIEFDDLDGLVAFVRDARMKWQDGRIYLNNDDVSEEIRSPIVTSAIKHLADLKEVRELLSEEQRRIADGRNIVTEGRDQGSEVFPDAECKIFLTASPMERAKRRQQQLNKSGKHMPLEDILQTQDKRDEEDRKRPVGTLRPAKDAVVIDSDGMTPEEVLERALEIVQSSKKVESDSI
ncbi:MAG: (d)CMP kinase [Planctomycetota bacterium]